MATATTSSSQEIISFCEPARLTAHLQGVLGGTGRHVVPSGVDLVHAFLSRSSKAPDGSMRAVFTDMAVQVVVDLDLQLDASALVEHRATIIERVEALLADRQPSPWLGLPESSTFLLALSRYVVRCLAHSLPASRALLEKRCLVAIDVLGSFLERTDDADGRIGGVVGMELGEYFIRNGEIERATSHLEAALERDPSSTAGARRPTISGDGRRSASAPLCADARFTRDRVQGLLFACRRAVSADVPGTRADVQIDVDDGLPTNLPGDEEERAAAPFTTSYPEPVSDLLSNVKEGTAQMLYEAANAVMRLPCDDDLSSMPAVLGVLLGRLLERLQAHRKHRWAFPAVSEPPFPKLKAKAFLAATGWSADDAIARLLDVVKRALHSETDDCRRSRALATIALAQGHPVVAVRRLVDAIRADVNASPSLPFREANVLRDPPTLSMLIEALQGAGAYLEAAIMCQMGRAVDYDAALAALKQHPRCHNADLFEFLIVPEFLEALIYVHDDDTRMRQAAIDAMARPVMSMAPGTKRYQTERARIMDEFVLRLLTDRRWTGVA
ncbi:Uncharacterized protein PBTT_03301 [Plasmodiophora brassicae]